MLRSAVPALLLACACSDPMVSGVVPLLVPSQDTVDFGEVYVGAEVTKSASVRASGSAHVSVRSVRLEGSAAFSLEPVAPRQLQRGASLAIAVRFRPTGLGAVTATLLVENDSDNEPLLRILLYGSGLPAPACEDHNPCTDDSFDAGRGECRHVAREGTCDDGNRCTTGEACIEGQCRGVGVTCEDGNPCSSNLCDATKGCLFVVDPAGCDDQNPCTADSCDPSNGCGHTALVDGTPCGPIAACDDLRLCAKGQCQRFNAPNGTPCSDGDSCTVGDQCQAGACTGTDSVTPPEVLSELATFGVPGIAPLVLPSDRLVFAGAGRGWPARQRLLVVEKQGGRLEVVDGPEVATGELIGAVGPDSFVMAAYAAASTAYTALSLDAGGRVTSRGAVSVPGRATDHASFGSTLYLCDDAGNLRVVSFEDLDAPAELLSLPRATGCSRLAVDASAGRLFVLEETALRAFSLANPSAPVELTPGVPLSAAAYVVAGEGVLVLISPFGGVQLLRSSDLLPLASIDGRACNNGQLVGRLLWCVESAAPPLHSVFDLSNPAQPTELASLADPRYAGLARGGTRLVTISDRRSGTRVFSLSRTSPPTLHELTGRAHGLLRSLVSLPSGLHAVSPLSVHRLDTSQVDAPSWSAGALLPSSAVLAGFGPGGAAPLSLLAPRYMRRDPAGRQVWDAMADEAKLWVDVSDPNQPRTVGSLQQSGLTALFDSRALQLTGYVPDALFDSGLALLDLRGATPSFGRSFAPAATTALDPAAPAGEFARGAALDVSADGSRAFFATRRVTLTSSSEWKGFLVALDGSSSLQVIARHSFPRPVTTVALAHDHGATRVLTLEIGDPALWQARELHLYEPAADGGLTERALLVLPESSTQLLSFDGRHAFVGAASGKVYVADLGTTPPRLLGQVQLGEPAHSATFVGDRLYVSGSSTVSVVYPPCPPR